MTKKAIIHKLELAVPVIIKKSSVQSKLVTREDGVQYLPEGTLLKPSTGDFRKEPKNVVNASATDVKGILVNTLEFRPSEKEKIATVMLEGIVYFDRLKKVETSINEAQLPTGIRYIYKGIE